MSLVYYVFFSSGVYLYFRILMYVKCHKQLEIGCGAILNKIYYTIILLFKVASFFDGQFSGMLRVI